MSLVMLYICSKKEGSVVNLDLGDAISWSFHFMIYMSLVPRAVEVDENCFGMQWEGGICLGEMGAPPSLGCRALKLDSWRGECKNGGYCDFPPLMMSFQGPPSDEIYSDEKDTHASQFRNPSNTDQSRGIRHAAQKSVELE
jgi:hypothetical protein